MEAVSYTSIVILRGVGGDEKASLEFQGVKYHRVSHWTLDPRMTVLAKAGRNCKRQTRPLVRESSPYQ
jgi:hypothetical protein